MTDDDMGRSLARGALIGLPIIWMVSFGIMGIANVGMGVAAGASVFVAAFGPYRSNRAAASDEGNPS